jgi:hypothetical protein
MVFERLRCSLAAVEANELAGQFGSIRRKAFDPPGEQFRISENRMQIPANYRVHSSSPTLSPSIYTMRVSKSAVSVSA